MNCPQLSGGEYVSLGRVEAACVSGCTLVDNVMLYADPFRDHVVALAVPNVPAFAAKYPDLAAGGLAGLAGNARAGEVLAKEFAEVRKAHGFAPFEAPKAVHVVGDEWTPASGLVTESMKVKRAVIVKRYKAELDALYARR